MPVWTTWRRELTSVIRPVNLSDEFIYIYPPYWGFLLYITCKTLLPKTTEIQVYFAVRLQLRVQFVHTIHVNIVSVSASIILSSGSQQFIDAT
jgi:hypothetical protein